MVNNFLYFPVDCRGRLRITPSPQAILFRLSTHATSGFVHLSAETLQGENFSLEHFYGRPPYETYGRHANFLLAYSVSIRYGRL